MGNIESQKGSPHDSKENLQNERLWIKREGSIFSPMELQDFGKFLMGSEEHREGKLVCLQLHLEDPLEVTFFSDNPEKVDDIYHIKQDSKNRAFEVTTVRGVPGRIETLLQEFGFEPKK